MDAQEILLTIGGSIAVVMAIAGLVATIWAVARVKGIEQSVELISKANVELRAANEDLRRELHESSAECAD